MDTTRKTTTFYKKLKATGLSKLMTKERNKAYLDFIKKHTNKKQKILDSACGYGRLTIPLAKAKYNISGIDLTSDFIKDAKIKAKEKNLKIDFKVGNMVKLPYKNESFDRIFCMWSSFSDILKQKDQIMALNEMHRVLKKNGLAAIDMPYYKKPATKGINITQTSKKNSLLSTYTVNGNSFITCIHNKDSLKKIIQKSKLKKTQIKIENIGKRKRLVLYMYK